MLGVKPLFREDLEALAAACPDQRWWHEAHYRGPIPSWIRLIESDTAMAGPLQDWRLDGIFTTPELSRVVAEAIQMRREHEGSFIILAAGHDQMGVQELKENYWHDGRWDSPDHELSLGHLLTMLEGFKQQEQI